MRKLKRLITDRSVCDLAVQVTARLFELELELLGAIVHVPSRGIINADAAGVNAAYFVNEDLRTIYLACEVLWRLDRLGGDTDGDRARVACLAAAGLRAVRLWDDGAVRRSRGPAWSEASLACFMLDRRSYSLVHELAPRIQDLRDRLVDAAVAVEQARRCLTSIDSERGDVRDIFADAATPALVDPARWSLALVRGARLTGIPSRELHQYVMDQGRKEQVA